MATRADALTTDLHFVGSIHHCESIASSHRQEHWLEREISLPVDSVLAEDEQHGEDDGGGEDDEEPARVLHAVLHGAVGEDALAVRPRQVRPRQVGQHARLRVLQDPVRQWHL